MAHLLHWILRFYWKVPLLSADQSTVDLLFPFSQKVMMTVPAC